MGSLYVLALVTSGHKRSYISCDKDSLTIRRESVRHSLPDFVHSEPFCYRLEGVLHVSES